MLKKGESTLSIFSNIFASTKTLVQEAFAVDLYKVEGIPRDLGHFKFLQSSAEYVSRATHSMCTSYTPEDGDFIVALEPRLSFPKIETDHSVMSLVASRQPLLNYPQQARELYYGAARFVLMGRGMWRGEYNTLYELKSEHVLDRLGVLRGMHIRFDLIGGRISLALDPVTKIVDLMSVWDSISQSGQPAIRNLIGKNVLAIQDVGNGIYEIVKVDLETHVTEPSITIGETRYSVKDYLRRRGAKNPELADRVSDSECNVIVRSRSGKEYTMAPSLLNVIVQPFQLQRDPTSERVRQEVYLTAQRRLTMSKRFLAQLNPLKLAPDRHVFFREEPLSSRSHRADILPPVSLRFKDRASSPDYVNYRRFMKDMLLQSGPARTANFAHGRVVIVYPTGFRRDQVLRFYEDCKASARKYFKTNLPPSAILWDYPHTDVRQEFDAYKEEIDAMICILKFQGDTQTYHNFKDWFAVPNQMVTRPIIEQRFAFAGSGRYDNCVLNVCSGILTKMGGWPWILDKTLSDNFYVGIDVGGEKNRRVACYTFFDSLGEYREEKWQPQRGEKINPQELVRIITNEVRRQQNEVRTICLHRDGEFQEEELEAIELIKTELDSNGKRSGPVEITCVNIKKHVPYRLYDITDDARPCRIGSYFVLDSRSAILATTGSPLLSQGLAKPLLVELVEPYTHTNIESVIHDIYALSYMHWGSITMKMKLPATLRYADALTPFALRNLQVKGVPV